MYLTSQLNSIVWWFINNTWKDYLKRVGLRCPFHVQLISYSIYITPIKIQKRGTKIRQICIKCINYFKKMCLLYFFCTPRCTQITKIHFSSWFMLMEQKVLAAIFFLKKTDHSRMKGGLNKIQCKGRLRQILAIVNFVSKLCFQQDFVDLLKLFHVLRIF